MSFADFVKKGTKRKRKSIKLKNNFFVEKGTTLLTSDEEVFRRLITMNSRRLVTTEHLLKNQALFRQRHVSLNQ